MSSFSRQPCPTCNAETLHRFSVCLTCKTTRVTPTDQYRAAGERIRKRRFVDSKFKRVVEHANNRRWYDKRLDNSSKIPTAANGSGVFGRGRERTKL